MIIFVSFATELFKFISFEMQMNAKHLCTIMNFKWNYIISLSMKFVQPPPDGNSKSTIEP